MAFCNRILFSLAFNPSLTVGKYQQVLFRILSFQECYVNRITQYITLGLAYFTQRNFLEIPDPGCYEYHYFISSYCRVVLRGMDVLRLV